MYIVLGDLMEVVGVGDRRTGRKGRIPVSRLDVEVDMGHEEGSLHSSEGRYQDSCTGSLIS